MESWDPVAFRTLLRTTSQRLGQLQERKDSQGQLTRRDIATYLSQGHLSLARAKAATLLQEDIMADLMEELEMQVGIVGRHAEELRPGGTGVGLGLWQDVGEAGGDTEVGTRENGMGGRMGKTSRLSPVLVEAAASIIHAAPSTESKELHGVREILIQQLGPTFVQTASATRNNHVSSRIMQILSSPPPTASRMDGYLIEIAHTYNIKWAPEPRREDLIDVISEILRVDVGSSPIVDLPRLREICARGLPDNPSWIRPRIWRLLFGTLPVLKTTWAKESQKQRGSYYDLVGRLLAPLASLPSPTDPLSPTDARITQISDSLFRVSPDLFALLGNEPKKFHSCKCPLDPTAPDTIQIACASDLDKRLSLLKGNDDTYETPEIRLELDLNGSDPASSSPPAKALDSRRQRRPTTLLPSKAYNAPPAHRAHLSALLRLLYIHNSLNPAVQSPHVPWLLVPLYSALVGESNEDDVAHAEADTFWVFEALIGEIAEMEEEDGGKIWTRKLGERVKWADGELAASLHATGLDPALPHYSYRWLAPLLAQSLPLSSVFPTWDVIFARPIRTRDVNPKLECLVDVCTALLIRARTPLFRLGKPARNAPGLWTHEHTALPPPSPLRPWELSDAFTEGIALLTSYPIDAAGGIDRILQTVADLAQKRIEEGEREKERERANVGFGARIKQQMWKGFTNQVADVSPEEEEEEAEEEEDDDNNGDETVEHDDGNETETPAAPTLTSRLANTVWRGITNQSSMDDEVPSPPSPLSTRHSPTPVEEQEIEGSSSDPVQSSQARLWDYAEKLKDSDTVAVFSKVSTNWRAKVLDGWRVRKGSDASTSSAPDTPAQSRRVSLPETPGEGDNATVDPPRPAFFRSPRESFLPQPRRHHATVPSSPNVGPTPPPLREPDTEPSASFLHRAGVSLASLASSQSSRSTAKSVPRPLMLNSRGLIATKPQSHSEGGTPEYRGGSGQWGDVLFAAKNRHMLRQTSVSSMSSLSPSEAMNSSPYPFSGAYARSVGTGPRSDYESDESAAATSRRVALNRKSVSPMALASRSPRLLWNASSPGGTRSPGHPLSNGRMVREDIETTSERGSKLFEEPVRPSVSTTGTTGFDSPTTIGSPPIPRTPLMPALPGPGVVRIVNGGHVGTSSISTLSEVSEASCVPPLEPGTQSGHVATKKTPPEDGAMTSTASESSLDRTPSGKVPMRLRTKRFVQRSGNVRLKPTGTGGHEQQRTNRTPSPRQLSLTPEWGEFDPATTPKLESRSGRLADEEVGRVEEGGEGSGAVLSRASIVRKVSKEVRSRETRRARDSSGAEEGDDEGYDDLLSAYESEEGSRE